ncbi:MAG: class I SAM-dependent methyltransferase [Pseudomonadota bacterium]
MERVISCESVNPYSYLGFTGTFIGNNSTLGQAMINGGHVHIHQFKPDGAVVDAAALVQFQQHWATYGKLVSKNSLSHREVTDLLHSTLSERFTSPFNFLDIACGDASLMPEALHKVPVRHYHGIDLSQPALELAAANLAELPCEVDLDHRDFFEALARRTEHADVAWCSLSIHHLATDNKLDVLRAIHDALGQDGIFLLYEPACGNGEDREAYLERFRQTNFRLWDYLSKPEWDQIWEHVSTCDFPEDADQWLELGRAAGFGSVRQVFADPTDFYRLFRFDA